MRRVAPRGHQDGGSQYSQSPLEPVLVNMVPPDLEPPRGYRGRESKGDGIRRLRRRTRGGALRRAALFHSRGRQRMAHARPVGFALPSLPGWEGKCVPRGYGMPFWGFPTTARIIWKRNGMAWEDRRCNCWERHFSAQRSRQALEPKKPQRVRAQELSWQLLTSPWIGRRVLSTHAQALGRPPKLLAVLS